MLDGQLCKHYTPVNRYCAKCADESDASLSSINRDLTLIEAVGKALAALDSGEIVGVEVARVTLREVLKKLK